MKFFVSGFCIIFFRLSLLFLLFFEKYISLSNFVNFSVSSSFLFLMIFGNIFLNCCLFNSLNKQLFSKDSFFINFNFLFIYFRIGLNFNKFSKYSFSIFSAVSLFLKSSKIFLFFSKDSIKIFSGTSFLPIYELYLLHI